MLAEIITIGNELLIGSTINTNSATVAQYLHEVGLSIGWMQTVGDSEKAIKDALNLALKRSNVVLITGGLGPTHDDLTKNTLSAYFASDLVFNKTIFKRIKRRFDKRGIPLPEVNRSQAMIPIKATLMMNDVGTAPGLIFRKNGKIIFVLPGVPFEMESMLVNSVVPLLKKEYQIFPVKVDLFRTIGIPESVIYEKIIGVLSEFSTYEMAFLPKPTGVDVRLIRRGDDRGNPEKFEKFKKILYNVIGDYIYSTENLPLEMVLGKLLENNNLSISVAESITGGLVQDKITNVPGSSKYFLGGVVAYHNKVKEQLLSVNPESLQLYGAVSETVAREMAIGVRKLFKADIGVSTTGIAGPNGATPQKQVGLVFIGIAFGELIEVKKYQFADKREVNKIRSAHAALDLVRRSILGLPL